MMRKQSKHKKLSLRQKVMLGLGAVTGITALVLVGYLLLTPKNFSVVIYNENNEVQQVGLYRTFYAAHKKMKQADGFNPAVLSKEKDLLAIRYGIVDFATKTCSENTSYTIDSNDEIGYTNGCYGADGIYLDTSSSGDQIKFMQSGAVGWVDRSEIRLLNYYDSDHVKSVNYYMTDKEGSLIHMGTSDVASEAYPIKIKIGEQLDTMDRNVYYSYDGHYFYEDFKTMADDYQKETYENSINADSPYFNYYQFVSHRTKTAYEKEDIDWYIQTYLGYEKKPDAYPMEAYASQLYGEGQSFIDAQNRYGVNAVMMLSLAINESGFGRSEISFYKNNLFGHAAYDHAPNEQADGYAAVKDSIYTHASVFIDHGYANPCDQSDAQEHNANTCYGVHGSRYHGSYFGDKGSGMNVKYASDPYWGEKAAQYYRSFDIINGRKDQYTYRILPIMNRDGANVYSEPDDDSTLLYRTAKDGYSVVQILEEVEGTEINGSSIWYKIQSDVALNKDRTGISPGADPYDFEHNTAYIHASALRADT